MDTFFHLLIVITLPYIVMLFYLRRGLRKCKFISEVNEPAISIIVSMHNEEKNAGKCLERLIRQDYAPSKMEIIIIDDRSTDQTPLILAEYKRRHNQLQLITVKDVAENITPKKNAIDRAIGQANGEIILLTDADGRPPDTWARQMISFFSHDTGMVIGYAPYLSSGPYRSFHFRLLALEYLSHAAIAAATTCLGYPLTCVGTNMAYRKDVFKQLSGFGIHQAIHSGDDDLFLQRVREETDWQIRYCPDPKSHVWNAPPASWGQFFQQRLRYASKGFLYPARITLVLICFYILNLLFFMAPFSLLFGTSFALYLVLVFALKGGSELLFISEAAIYLKDRRHLALFPFAFLLHIPYVIFFGLLSQLKSFRWANRKS